MDARQAVVVYFAVFLSIEYAYIGATWRRPVFGYRMLLGTCFVLTICFEIEKRFGKGYLEYLPRTIVLVVAINFFIFETWMWFRRLKHERKRRIYVEERLVEDAICQA